MLFFPCLLVVSSGVPFLLVRLLRSWMLLRLMSLRLVPIFVVVVSLRGRRVSRTCRVVLLLRFFIIRMMLLSRVIVRLRLITVRGLLRICWLRHLCM